MVEVSKVDIRMDSTQKSFLQGIPRIIPEACPRCRAQELALRRLWSQVQERAHPTNFSWHCQVCGKEVRMAID